MSRKRKPKELDEGLLQRGWNALIQLKGLELPELPEGKFQLGVSFLPSKAASSFSSSTKLTLW